MLTQSHPRTQQGRIRPIKDVMHKIMSDPPPYVSAKSWAIADGNTGKILFGKGETEHREIASLTKIMTCYTALKLATKYDVNLDYTRVLVSQRASKIGGTTAELSTGDTLYLWDLFHGMMLPSGNDAAIAIAEYFGQVVKDKSLPEQRVDAKDHKTVLKNPSMQRLFVNEMNKNAKELGLTETQYANPHGLNNFYNKSNACDVAKLSSIAMKDPKFRQIVSCKIYKAKGMTRDGEDKFFKWINTNRLLEKGYNGVKTGVTQCAGPCLVTSLQKPNVYLIFVLLNSKSMESRWGEIKKLKKWVFGRLFKIDNALKDTPGMDKERLLTKLLHV